MMVCILTGSVSNIMYECEWELEQSIGSFPRLNLKLVFEFDHHRVVPLLHLINFLQFLGYFLLGLLQVLFEVQLHQVLNVVRHLLDYAIQQLDELLDPTLYGVLQVDVLLRDV